MSHTIKHKVSFRHTILMAQLGAFALSLSPIQMYPLFSILIYCLAVFPSPFLMLSYYRSYLSHTENWFWNGIPCVAETFFVILYIGAMIYGIRFETNSILFSQLLSAYLTCALLCVLGYLTCYMESN